MIRVLIVDHHGLARAGLRMILAAQADIEVVGVATDGAEAVKAARQLVVDVALMDIQMAGVSGLEAARQLVAMPSQRPVRVLIVTAFDLDEYIDEAPAIGVSGFIVKSASPEELVAAVRARGPGRGVPRPVGDSPCHAGVRAPRDQACGRAVAAQLTDRKGARCASMPRPWALQPGDRP